MLGELTTVVASIDDTIAVRPLLEHGLALHFGDTLDHLRATTPPKEVLEVDDALLEPTLRRHLLRDPAIAPRNARPEDGTERHQVWVRGAIDVAALKAVGAEPCGGSTDGVHLSRCCGVARVEHRVVGLCEHLAAADDDGAERLPLLGLTLPGSALCCLDCKSHELLMLLVLVALPLGTARHGQLQLLCRAALLRAVLADEDLLVHSMQRLSITAGEPPPQGLVHHGVREQVPHLLQQEPIVDLDHVLCDLTSRLLQAHCCIGPVAATSQAIAS
mmetsp:Transcript_108436/g.271808  ORF Transcript_108436/g.271808 Transcript_108436/m.271808 type:complete len:274 (-) Transcript_108436:592-1413(-)